MMIGKLKRTGFVLGLAAVFAAAGLVSFAVVYAQDPPQGTPQRPHAEGLMGPGGPPPMRPGMEHGGFGPHMLLPRLPVRELGLTDAQLKQLEAIIEQHRSEMEPFAEQARTARFALEDAIEANDPDAIQAASTEVAKVELQIALLRAKVRAEVFQQVLTEEQRAKVEQLKARIKGEVEAARPHRHAAGPGLC